MAVACLFALHTTAQLLDVRQYGDATDQRQPHGAATYGLRLKAVSPVLTANTLKHTPNAMV